MAVGPQESGEWRDAAERTHGRVRRVGIQPVLDTYLDAADIYVISHPMASATTALEAGIRGIPIISYRAHTREAEVLAADAPGLDGHILGPTNPLAYEATLEELVTDESVRRPKGAETRESILETHCGDGSIGSCQRICDTVLGMERDPTGDEGVRGCGNLDIVLELFQQRTIRGNGVASHVLGHIAVLPGPTRLAACAELRCHTDTVVRLRDLLPEWTRNQLRILWPKGSHCRRPVAWHSLELGDSSRQRKKLGELL